MRKKDEFFEERLAHINDISCFVKEFFAFAFSTSIFMSI